VLNRDHAQNPLPADTNALWVVTVSASQYAKLLGHFKGQEVPVGTSRDKTQSGSLGEWLQVNVTRTAIASYLAPILVNEGYAHRVTEQTKIKFKGLRELCGG